MKSSVSSFSNSSDSAFSSSDSASYKDSSLVIKNRVMEGSSPSNEASKPHYYYHTRYGIQRIKTTVITSDKKGKDGMIKEKWNSSRDLALTSLVLEYQQLSTQLGIEEDAAIVYQTSEQKIHDMLRLLVLLVKILERGERDGFYFITDTLIELNKFYFWTKLGKKFTEQDKEYLAVMADKDFRHKEKYKYRIYQLLHQAIKKSYTPALLLHVIHGIRAINNLRIDVIEPHLIEDARSKLIKRHQKKAKHLKNADQPYNIFLYLAEAMDKVEEHLAILESRLESNKKLSFALFDATTIKLKKDIEEAAMAVYFHCEETIKAAVVILSNPAINVDKILTVGKNKRTRLNEIILFHLNIHQWVLSLSGTLNTKLQQQNQILLSIAEIRDIVRFDDISYVYVNGDENLKIDPMNKVHEEDLVKDRLTNIKHKLVRYKAPGEKLVSSDHPNSDKRQFIGNERVFLINDTETRTNWAVRGKPTSTNDEELGREPHQLRFLVSNSLLSTGITSLYFIVKGALDPATKYSDLSHRNYEFSEAVLINDKELKGKDLMDEFDELHAAYQGTHSKIALLDLSCHFIDYGLQIVKWIAYLKKLNRFYSDLKPRNILIGIQDDKKLIRVSDQKSLCKPDNDKNFLSSAYIYETATFHTMNFIYYNEKEQCTYKDLNILMHETVVFTLAQLLTKTEIEHHREKNGPAIQYKELCDGLAKHAYLYEGPIGAHIKFFVDWMLKFFHSKSDFEDLFSYFNQDQVLKSLSQAKAEVISAHKKLAVVSHKMSPDTQHKM